MLLARCRLQQRLLPSALSIHSLGAGPLAWNTRGVNIPRVTDVKGGRWLYAPSDDGLARYVLGTEGDNPLVCIGLNPSTAVPGDLDKTLNLVATLAARSGNDSFIMLNLYPGRETHPTKLGQTAQDGWTQANKEYVAAVVDGKNLTLWAAWGWFVDERPYLLPALRDLLDLPELANCTWVSRGRPTKRKHPHHPLYVKKGTAFEFFDVGAYRGWIAGDTGAPWGPLRVGA